MLARDWYYNERRQIGLDSAVASIYELDDDIDLRARAALGMLGVQRGWRVADIGCGNGVLAVEAALQGAEVDAIDISPAMLARIHAALKPGANFYLRDIVYASMPDGFERGVEAWADFNIKNHDFARDSVVTHMRDEYSTFGWVMERMLTDAGFQLVSADYHAPLHGTYLLRKPKSGEQS